MTDNNEQQSVFGYFGEAMKIHLMQLESFRELGVVRSNFYRGLDTLKFMIMKYDPMYTGNMTEAIQQIENYPQRLEDIMHAREFIEWNLKRQREEFSIRRMEKEMQEKSEEVK
jgi:hypothetical protein